MPLTLQDYLRRGGPSLFPSYWLAGAACLGTLVCLRSISSSLSTREPKITPSPKETALPWLTLQETESLPYPPDPLPGRRDVGSPLGSTRVYEWGPKDGRKVLLIHGISTPSIALSHLAHQLVEKGYRVMLFDLFGRGYSSGPSPTTHRHDSALYATQIFICLQSSPIPWTSFSLVGYSLGGALAADFTSHFPNLVQSLILVAPGGLIRTSHITWKSRLLYSTSGLFPESLIEYLVARRLWSGPETSRTIEPEHDTGATALDSDDAVPGHRSVRKNEPRGGSRSTAVYTTSNHLLLPNHINSTASNVVDWQIQHHQGFIPAFISAIRYAPIHGQQPRWSAIRDNIENGLGKLKKVHIVLGETDPIVVAAELTKDAAVVLGEENMEVEVIQGVGHEVALSNAADIVRVVESSFAEDM